LDFLKSKWCCKLSKKRYEEYITWGRNFLMPLIMGKTLPKLLTSIVIPVSTKLAFNASYYREQRFNRAKFKAKIS
jgi:hypothetical protein